jgi:hypothetical protein
MKATPNTAGVFYYIFPFCHSDECRTEWALKVPRNLFGPQWVTMSVVYQESRFNNGTV